METKKLTKIDKLKLKDEKIKQELKKLKKIEKEKYDKSREKYRLRIGKIIDQQLNGKDIDSKAFKEYLNKYGSYIEKFCLKQQ